MKEHEFENQGAVKNGSMHNSKCSLMKGFNCFDCKVQEAILPFAFDLQLAVGKWQDSTKIFITQYEEILIFQSNPDTSREGFIMYV